MTAAFPKLMTAAEVADILTVSPRTVRRWAEQGQLVEVRLGGHTVRFLEKDVLDFIHRGVKDQP
jgi:excisionase family DNA binding protein